MKLVIYEVAECDNWRSYSSMETVYKTADSSTLDRYVEEYVRKHYKKLFEGDCSPLDRFKDLHNLVKCEKYRWSELLKEQRIPNLHLLEETEIDLETLVVDGYDGDVREYL